MARFKGNPILKPIPENSWESRYVFNPAMFELGDRIHYVYRAMGNDMVSRLGYASSKDGYRINERLSYPIFFPVNSLEKRGCEDPRITVFDDKCYMTFTAYSDIPQIGITSITTKDFLDKNWRWGARYYPFPSSINKNAVLFPSKIDNMFVMLHRIEPNIHIVYSEGLRKWQDSKIILRPREGMWDSRKIGAAGPPIKLPEGWLQIYHGVDEDYTYRLGAILLDKRNPEELLFRTRDPFLEPLEKYECNGLVPNVVFSCGAIMRNERVLVSYGCADTVIGVSTFSINEILSGLD